jgi:hypothetical protein
MFEGFFAAANSRAQSSLVVVETWDSGGIPLEKQ